MAPFFVMKTDEFGIPLNENVVQDLSAYISKLRSEFGEKAMKSIPDVKSMENPDASELAEMLTDIDNAIMRASDKLTQMEFEA